MLVRPELGHLIHRAGAVPSVVVVRSVVGTRRTSLKVTSPTGVPPSSAVAADSSAQALRLPGHHPQGVAALRERTHGQVIAAHAPSTSTATGTRYHGHGPSTSSRDAVSGLALRKP